MNILDGKKLSQKIADDLRVEIIDLEIKPKLIIVQIGQNQASEIYLKHKVAFAEKIGVLCKVLKVDQKTKQEGIEQIIKELNKDKNVHGIIIQLPVPDKFNSRKLINCIDPKKDVDGLTDTNLGKILSNEGGILPATPQGIRFLLEEYKIPVEGKNIVVIGRSVLAGKSIALALLNQGATVTICHSKTLDLKKHLETADIIVSAVGKNGIVNDSNIGENQIIIDVGIDMTGDKLVGDVDVANREKILFLSPVPGGVGPMTVASLFHNLYLTYANNVDNH